MKITLVSIVRSLGHLTWDKGHVLTVLRECFLMLALLLVKLANKIKFLMELQQNVKFVPKALKMMAIILVFKTKTITQVMVLLLLTLIIIAILQMVLIPINAL